MQLMLRGCQSVTVTNPQTGDKQTNNAGRWKIRVYEIWKYNASTNLVVVNQKVVWGMLRIYTN